MLNWSPRRRSFFSNLTLSIVLVCVWNLLFGVDGLNNALSASHKAKFHIKSKWGARGLQNSLSRLHLISIPTSLSRYPACSSSCVFSSSSSCSCHACRSYFRSARSSTTSLMVTAANMAGRERGKEEGKSDNKKRILKKYLKDIPSQPKSEYPTQPNLFEDEDDSSKNANDASKDTSTSIEDEEGKEQLSSLFHPDAPDLDIEFITETVMDQSIERAVSQMMSDPPSSPDIPPEDKFNQMYLDFKSGKNTTALDPAAMLAQLFPDDPGRDPFDERKVMMKLKNILTEEDFKDLFLNPEIGDWL